jgi:hypothetical protein
MKSYLDSIDFFELFRRPLSPSAVVEQFCGICNHCTKLYVTLKRTTASNKLRLTHYPSHTEHKLRRKAIAWCIYCTFKSPELLESYKKIASDCKSAIYSHSLCCESHLVDSGNTGKFL